MSPTCNSSTFVLPHWHVKDHGHSAKSTGGRFIIIIIIVIIIIIIIIIIYPLTARVGGAPKIISQPVFSIFPCSPLPSGTWRTPGLSIPWCCLPTSSSVCLVFFPLSLCLASIQWSGGLRVVRLPAGSWHELPRW